MHGIFTIHLALTLYMTGLIWFVQVVHYPLMGRVGASSFLDYERNHTRLTSWVTAPPMLVELGTGILLYYFSGAGLPHLFNLVLLTAIWMSTFLLQVPLHNQLSEAFNAGAHRRLVRTNWLRTIAWTARAILLSLMAYWG